MQWLYLSHMERGIILRPRLQAPRPPAPVPTGPERLQPHAVGRAAAAGAAALPEAPQPGSLRMGQRTGWVGGGTSHLVTAPATGTVLPESDSRTF